MLQVERWAARSHFVAFSFVDSRVVLTRVDSGDLLRTLQPKEAQEGDTAAAVWSLQVASDGSLLLGLSSGHLEVWPEWRAEEGEEGGRGEGGKRGTPVQLCLQVSRGRPLGFGRCAAAVSAPVRQSAPTAASWS